MKTTTFRMWKSNRFLLDVLKEKLEKKRGQLLSRNLIINEALKNFIEDFENVE